jgi:hypothetical protein
VLDEIVALTLVVYRLLSPLSCRNFPSEEYLIEHLS